MYYVILALCSFPKGGAKFKVQTLTLKTLRTLKILGTLCSSRSKVQAWQDCYCSPPSLVEGQGGSLFSEEQVADEECCHDACRIGQQPAGHGMACLPDAHTAEIDGQNVEGGVCRALEQAGQAAYE